MERAEYKYEANLEARLMDLEAKQRAEATEALMARRAPTARPSAASDRGVDQGPQGRRRPRRVGGSGPGRDQGGPRGPGRRSDRRRVGGEGEGGSGAAVQAGLRDVATRLAAESGEAGSGARTRWWPTSTIGGRR